MAPNDRKRVWGYCLLYGGMAFLYFSRILVYLNDAVIVMALTIPLGIMAMTIGTVLIVMGKPATRS